MVGYDPKKLFRRVKPTLGMEDKFPFGRHAGKKVEDILEDDPQYILWFDENVTQYHLDQTIVRAALDG